MANAPVYLHACCSKVDSELVKRHHLTLRRARSAHLEGWAPVLLLPTLRDAH